MVQRTDLNSDQRKRNLSKVILTCLSLLVSYLFISLISAQNGWAARASGDRLTSKQLAALGPTLQQYVDKGHFVGLVSLIAHQGEIVHLRKFGKRDLSTGEPMTADTIFRIYSMTKPLTSTATMILVQQGKLNLDDPVSKYIPEMGNVEVFVADTDEGMISIPAQSPITIRQLLTHTSGLTAEIMGESSVHKRYKQIARFGYNGDLKQYVNELSEIPLIAQPGMRFNYSMSMEVLGRVIEVISGQTLDAFVKTNITKPLGMHDTDYYVPQEKLHRFADNYRIGASGRLELYDDNMTGYWSGKKPKLLVAGAGMVSTPTDYFRFCQMILNEGHLNRQVRLLTPATVQMMKQNQLPEHIPYLESLNVKGVGFGFGFGIVQDPIAHGETGSVGEMYWGGSASTTFWIDPQEQIIGIVMAQVYPPSPVLGELRQKVKTIVYDALKN